MTKLPFDQVPHEAREQDNYLLNGIAEMPDPTPVAPPLGYKKQPSMVEIIRNMVRSEKLAQEAAAAGAETFEESEDFDVGDDFEPSSPYENDFDPPISDIRREVENARPKPPSAAPAAPPSAPPPNPPSDGPAAPTPPTAPAGGGR